MPKILNIGSINIDFVYQVDHFPKIGETLAADALIQFPGGKGLNQSIAMSYSGADVYHAGKTGPDGRWLIDELIQAGVKTEYIEMDGSKTGHAIIQIIPDGQNNILSYPGANFELDKKYIDTVLSNFSAGDIIVLQNEVNNIAYIMQQAYKKAMTIVFNPSPITKEIPNLPLNYVAYFLLNEIEGEALTGKKKSEEIITEMTSLYPDAAIVLTIGKHGVLFRKGDFMLSHGVYNVPVVDTTAAGDTFTGYFIGSIAIGRDANEALHLASLASSISVSRYGASASIPKFSELTQFRLQ